MIQSQFFTETNSLNASRVRFDSNGSGITASDVQNAISEIDTTLNALDASNIVVDATGNTVILDSDLQTWINSADIAFLNARNTGVRVGGLVTFTPGGTTFDVGQTSGEIKDSTGYVAIDFPGQTNIPIIAFTGSIYVYIDKNNTVQQQTTAPTAEEFRSKLFLIRLAISTNSGTIVASEQLINTLTGSLNTLRDYISFVASPKKGLNISPNTDLTFQSSAGEIFELGGNFSVNPDSPNIKQFPAINSVSFFYVNRTTTYNSNQATIDVLNYDNNGVQTQLSNNRFKIETVYKFNSGNTLIQQGQNQYTSIDAAQNAINSRDVALNPAVLNGTRIGWIIVAKNATNLSDPAQAKFIQDTGVSNTSVLPTGVLFANNNLSDVVNTATARSNLGLAIGTNVQAYSSILQNTTASYTTADKAKVDTIRIKMTANTNFYVSPTGSDSNDGLTSGTPKQTIQAAVDLVTNNYDCNGFAPLIFLADGTYNATTTNGVTLKPLVGSSRAVIIGNSSNPENVRITTESPGSRGLIVDKSGQTQWSVGNVTIGFGAGYSGTGITNACLACVDNSQLRLTGTIILTTGRGSYGMTCSVESSIESQATIKFDNSLGTDISSTLIFAEQSSRIRLLGNFDFENKTVNFLGGVFGAFANSYIGSTGTFLNNSNAQIGNREYQINDNSTLEVAGNPPGISSLNNVDNSSIVNGSLVYSNTVSGLNSTTVKGAIDELAGGRFAYLISGAGNDNTVTYSTTPTDQTYNVSQASTADFSTTIDTITCNFSGNIIINVSTTFACTGTTDVVEVLNSVISSVEGSMRTAFTVITNSFNNNNASITISALRSCTSGETYSIRALRGDSNANGTVTRTGFGYFSIARV